MNGNTKEGGGATLERKWHVLELNFEKRHKTKLLSRYCLVDREFLVSTYEIRYLWMSQTRGLQGGLYPKNIAFKLWEGKKMTARHTAAGNFYFFRLEGGPFGLMVSS